MKYFKLAFYVLTMSWDFPPKHEKGENFKACFSLNKNTSDFGRFPYSKKNAYNKNSHDIIVSTVLAKRPFKVTV